MTTPPGPSPRPYHPAYDVDFRYEPEKHEATELWLRHPVSSADDSYFGCDRDQEFLAQTAEPWRAPVLSLSEDRFDEEKPFPDMDVGVLVRAAKARAKAAEPKRAAAAKPRLALAAPQPRDSGKGRGKGTVAKGAGLPQFTTDTNVI